MIGVDKNKMETKKIEKKAVSDKSEKTKVASAGLIAVVRIAGMVKVKKDVAETLDRLRLRKKYVCVLINSSDVNAMGMLKKVKHFVAYGNIDEKMLGDLVEARGALIEKGGEIDSKKIASELIGGKKLKDLGLKPFFRLHPPRKGIKSKLQYPRGVLGDNGSKINDLIGRML